MAATAVRTTRIPVPRSPVDDVRVAPRTGSGAAAAYQRVLHQLVRRELRMLAELATWAPADDVARSTELTRHAELISRVLLHHHDVERSAVWPALQQAVPAGDARAVRDAVDAWSGRCARIDHMLRDVATAARQWRVAPAPRSRDAFAMACLVLAEAVDASTEAEERELLPLIGAHLSGDAWAAITRAQRCDLAPAEQLMVLGLALEDSCPADRARLLGGLPRSARWAWRLGGERRYRAAVVRLRGAPPAA
jgi:hypothetical protein